MAENDTRYDREFGEGTLIGDNGENFFDKPLEQQVKELAWSHACPIPEEVIVAYGEKFADQNANSSPKEIFEGGATLAKERYAECNFVFKIIVETAKQENPSLYQDLIKPVERLENEPLGEYNHKNVPVSFENQMSPMSTPAGYALPRVAIEQMGTRKERSPERIQKALEAIDITVRSSTTPIELVINLSEKVSTMDADPKTVLYHLLSKEILEEENCVSIFKEMIKELRKSAPTLSKVYDSMSTEEKKALGIVDEEEIAFE